MSIRIRLKVIELQDPKLKALGIEIPIIRVICPVAGDSGYRCSHIVVAADEEN